MRLLAWDLENSPMLSYHWGRWNQNIRPDQTIEESRVLCFGAKWLDTGKYVFKSEYDHGREEMLQTIWDLLNEADGAVSWNGKTFDTRKINREFWLEKMPEPSPYVEVDLMRVAKRKFQFSSNKLDSVAKEAGVGEKVIHEGFTLWPKVMNGDPAARRLFKKYQRQDVELLVKLYDRFQPWIPASMHPNAALVDGLPFGCPKCSSQHLQRRGFKATSAGVYQQYQCQNCGGWSRGARRTDEVLPTTALRSL